MNAPHAGKKEGDLSLRMAGEALLLYPTWHVENKNLDSNPA